MKLYFAPLEGITTYTYRNTHAKMFGGCDAYFAPFVNPSDNEKVGRRVIRDILPERNCNMPLKIQALTNSSSAFLRFTDMAKDMGYDEININIGCPAGTVVKKGRGAGFLRNPDALDRFFDEVFSKTDIKISVKTRTGYFSNDEMDELMQIFNKYPFTLLIIHPRCRADFYNGTPHLNVFENAYNISKNPLCISGDIWTADDYRRIIEKFPNLDSVMLGRGAIVNPALFREIRGGAPLKTAELTEFSKQLAENYLTVLQSEIFTLQKLKEIWVYVLRRFEEEHKIAKAIKKSKNLTEFFLAAECLPER